MTTAEVLAAVRAWQATPGLHPLTCDNNSRHRPLVGVDEEGQAVLRCLDCDYRQPWIPDIVKQLRS